MELNIDTGVEGFRVNGRGVLRFNPADPNLYHRFFAAGAELDSYDAALTKALAALDGDEQQRAAAGLALLNEYDGKIKKLLTGIFGAENDFDAILGGVNLAGVGANGKRVVQNSRMATYQRSLWSSAGSAWPFSQRSSSSTSR